MSQKIHAANTQYGFEFGAAEVTRIHSDKKTGAVYLGVKTPKTEICVYVTKNGKLRVFEGNNEWKKQEEENK